MQLVIGNKNYSSWSMRPWLLLKHFDLAFEETRIPLFQEGYVERLAEYSPSLKVPVLIDGDLTIWESLAICEYVAENYLEGKGWPGELKRKALCRAYCNEMHGGFFAIRNELPMNCRAQKSLELSPAVLREVQRVDALWSEARRDSAKEGDYLFGEFSIADCMFAPMVMRFATYKVPVSEPGRLYMQAIKAHPAVREWCLAAAAEVEVLKDYEVGTDI